jgi:hypothetical protein
VAGVAGVIARNEVVLVVNGGDVAFIVNVETVAEIIHNVTREAEVGGFGPRHLFFEAQAHANRGKDEKADEGHHLSFLGLGEFGPQSDKQRHENGHGGNDDYDPSAHSEAHLAKPR